ncbi:hypothetical protein GH714_036648 [Hevea brasiliensis]|uniref:Uncharacterized protein n=1 Tax=Hevea brasiliensis TaxID=3981 RepID=A0A6A6M718_HEVBR|nr:hypothetical protein GH714_036648 [Hevea brasiliensis]
MQPKRKGAVLEEMDEDLGYYGVDNASPSEVNLGNNGADARGNEIESDRLNQAEGENVVGHGISQDKEQNETKIFMLKLWLKIKLMMMLLLKMVGRSSTRRQWKDEREPIGSQENMRSGGMDASMRFEHNETDSEYVDSDELFSDSNSYGEGNVRYPEFDFANDKRDPTFKMG